MNTMTKFSLKTETKFGFYLPLTKFASKICLFPVVKENDNYARLNECIDSVDKNWIIRTHDTKYNLDISYIDFNKFKSDLSKYHKVNNNISGFIINVKYNNIPAPNTVLPVYQKYVSDNYVGYISIAEVINDEIEKFFIPKNTGVKYSEYYVFGKKGNYNGILSPYKPIYSDNFWLWITNSKINKFMQSHQELFNNIEC